MGLHVMTGLTPQLTQADLPRLTGDVVLGEPLPVLMSAVLRMRLLSVEDGLATLSGTLTRDEINSLRRAMARVELPAGARSADRDDELRFVAVIREASRAANAAVARILAQPA